MKFRFSTSMHALAAVEKANGYKGTREDGSLEDQSVRDKSADNQRMVSMQKIIYSTF